MTDAGGPSRVDGPPGGQVLVVDFDLERFVGAQDGGGTYEAALAELRSGRKRGCRSIRYRQ